MNSAELISKTAKFRCICDLLAIYRNKSMYINEKGYLQKLIDTLYKLGYYEDNEPIFSDEEC